MKYKFRVIYCEYSVEFRAQMKNPLDPPQVGQSFHSKGIQWQSWISLGEWRNSKTSAMEDIYEKKCEIRREIERKNCLTVHEEEIEFNK